MYATRTMAALKEPTLATNGLDLRAQVASGAGPKIPHWSMRMQLNLSRLVIQLND